VRISDAKCLMPLPPHTLCANPREAPRQEHDVAWDRRGLPPDRRGEWVVEDVLIPLTSFAATMLPLAFSSGEHACYIQD
jgi:hypothetical protein